ncbi:DUF2188 domain-containing protein [Cupriavidus sp. 2TAF22]|uniref:DUF2188 domain-containing protein n=1 Tax=unclassified Cupriavidus TaxID=2640874 RepID=UPI003F93B426
MLRDFIVLPTQTGWVLKVAGAATAILQYDTREEAAQAGAVLAARHAVRLILDESGNCADMVLAARP